VEQGASWRPFWAITALLVVLLVLDRTALGGGVPALVWVLAFAAVLGVVAGTTAIGRRAWTLRLTGAGPDAVLSVGRERVTLDTIDTDHLRAVRAGTAGVDAGAPVLGGGWSVPRGRTGLPLRLLDGRTVLVPTRDPAGLAAALLGRGAPGDGPPGGGTPGGDPGGDPGNRGTLAP
jgi:hypothetical protein